MTHIEPYDKDSTRRDFIYIATGAMGVIGAGAAAWPLHRSNEPICRCTQPGIR